MEISFVLIGIVLIVIGAMTARGNLSLLHSYHIKRVREEDKKPFARIMGIGNIIVGVGLAVCGFLPENVTTPVLTVFLVLGIGLCLFGLIKYNKGIF